MGSKVTKKKIGLVSVMKTPIILINNIALTTELHSLYGVGFDITTSARKLPHDHSRNMAKKVTCIVT